MILVMETIRSIDNIKALRAGEVAIWGADVSEMMEEIDALMGLLSTEELKKAERLKDEKARRMCVVARGGLRVLLGSYTKQDPSQVMIDQQFGGKPMLESGEMSFNLSHSGDWVVWAFADSGEVGVDLEQVRANILYARVAQRYFQPAEQQALAEAVDAFRLFFDMWAAKEALVKASGKGVFAAMNEVELPLMEGVVPDETVVGDWYLRRVEAGSMYACALAYDEPILEQPCYDFGGLQWRV
ncbi:MAG: 4'-phosphopantetheinyl transferase family protein [Pontiellaceae bacterium]